MPRWLVAAMAIAASASLLAAVSGRATEHARATATTSTTTACRPSTISTAPVTAPTGATTTTVPCIVGRPREIWTGTLATNEGGPGLTGATNGSFRLDVGRNGAVAGSGSSTSRYTSGSVFTSTIAISGTRTSHRFRLTLALTPGTSVAVLVRIDGRRAEGTYSLRGDGGTYAAGVVKLRCRHC